MEQMEIYLSIGITIISLIVSTLTFLTKFIQNVKSRKKAEQFIKITEDIIHFIEEAEKFTHYSGVEKKEYVMTKVSQILVQNKLKINYETIGTKIEELVALTKQVNSNRSSKELKALN